MKKRVDNSVPIVEGGWHRRFGVTMYQAGVMRIIHTVYGMDMGGMEVLVAQLCRIQRAQGHDVRIFAYAKLGVLGEQMRSEGFEVYVPGEAHPIKTMYRYFKRFRVDKPDVVHSHGVAPTIHSTLAARWLRVPSVISTRHNLLAENSNGSSSELPYNIISCFCHAVTGICQTTSDQLRKPPLSWRRRIRTVFNGAKAMESPGVPLPEKTGPTVLFVGRLMPVKSLQTLIHAVRQARQHIPNLNLWLVGDGSSRAELESLVQLHELGEAVTFWGQNMDVAPYFHQADIFAMSSTSEGLPMALLQAMSVGLPSVTTDVGGMGEVLRLADCGLLAPVGEVSQFSDAIVRLATDSSLRSQLSRNAKKGYLEHFTLECMAHNYMTLYTM